MLFTVLADYCLLIEGKQISGVLFFCLVQIIYALRYGGKKKATALILLMFLIFITARYFNMRILYTVSVMYAMAFIVNIIALLKLRHNTTIPYHNRLLMFTGMIMFAACDINVALYNIPWSFAQAHQQMLLFIIWLFYLPAQLLLAISAKDYSGG